MLSASLIQLEYASKHWKSTFSYSNDLSWDEWRLSDSEVERIDLENAASPEEADELEEMTADKMAVNGYYVVADIACHEYKQGWKFLNPVRWLWAI